MEETHWSWRWLAPGGLRPRLIGLVLLVTGVTEIVFAAAVTAEAPFALTEEVAWTAAMAVLVAAMLGALVAIHITRPLLRLGRAATLLAQGDLAQRVNFTQRDEIGDLGRAFDLMATALARRTADLEAANAGLAQQARQLSDLGEGGTLLQVCADAPRAYDVTRDYASRLFPGSAGMLYILNQNRLNQSGDTAELVGSWGDAPPDPTNARATFPLDACGALFHSESQWSSASSSTPWCSHLVSGGLADAGRAHLCAPVMVRGEQIGVLCLSFDAAELASECEGWSRWIDQLAMGLAGQLALVLRNLTVQQELQSQAIHDSLTSLFNRRYLDATLTREVRRAVRSGTPLSVVMLDVDEFKPVNDTLGHGTGDLLLRELGQMLQGYTRGGDVAARYGGDEFVLVMPNATWDDARARAEELRLAVKRLPVQSLLGSVGGVTVSAGVAGLPEAGTTETALLGAADAALYRAKADGRDRVIAATRWADPLVPGMIRTWSAEELPHVSANAGLVQVPIGVLSETGPSVPDAGGVHGAAVGTGAGA